MPSSIEIAWLAGLLEGEGCFTFASNKVTPRIGLTMTDRDIVSRAINLLYGYNRIVGTVAMAKYNPNYTTQHRLDLVGYKAAGWMMTVYKFMSTRRKARIKEILAVWRISKSGPKRRNQIA